MRNSILFFALSIAGMGSPVGAGSMTAAPKTPDAAIAMVLGNHPELKAYRSMTIPPQSIEATQYSPGSWLIAFIRIGRDPNTIIEARCFRVTRNGTVEPSGLYLAKARAPAGLVNPATCRPRAEDKARKGISSARWSILGLVGLAAFSAPGSRDHDLTLACAGPGELRLWFHVPPDAAPKDLGLLLRSGGFTAVLPAEWHEMRATPPPGGSAPHAGSLLGYELSATSRFDLPVVAQFLRTGKLQVRSAGRTLVADAEPLELAALATLLNGCVAGDR